MVVNGPKDVIDSPSIFYFLELPAMDEKRLEWEISEVRKSIETDFATLARGRLPADRRKAIREHLKICNSSLKTLQKKLRRPKEP